MQRPSTEAAPARRRRRRADRSGGTASLLSTLLLARVNITVSGKKSSRTVLEVILLQILQKALSGDAQATRILLKYQYLVPESTTAGLMITFVDNDYTRSLAVGLEVEGDG